MSMKTTLKASVAAAALFAVSAPVVSSPAEAGLANGNDNGVVISGALNRSMQYVDNGSANSWVNTDGGTDNSRLRILVSGQLTESIKVGGTWEANLPISNAQGSTTSSGTTEGSVTEAGTAAFGFRKTEVKFTHATMGSFTIGQGSTSSDNKPSLDGTVNNNAGMSHGGGMMIYDKTALAATTNTSGAMFASYFGGRKDRLRYDTPNIAGFTASVSVADSDYFDGGLQYGAAYGDLTIAAAVQAQHMGANPNSENVGGGVAVKHASGLSAGVHYGKETGTANTSTSVEGESWGVEAGYSTSTISNMGATSFNIVYTEADETTLDLFEAESIQFHFRQKMPAGVEAYAAYEIASFDDGDTTTSLDDVSVFLIGTKLSF
jgi:hypothetical protein